MAFLSAVCQRGSPTSIELGDDDLSAGCNDARAAVLFVRDDDKVSTDMMLKRPLTIGVALLAFEGKVERRSYTSMH